MTPISVIIPVRNEGEKISRTVRSLIFGRSCRFPLEIVIVDDASIDGACNALPQLANGMPEVRIIVRRLNSWSGIPFARNRGAEAASYPIYLITNGNTCYPDKWDQPIRRNFQRGRVLTGTISDLSSPFFGYGCALMLPSMGVTWLPTPHTYGGYAPVATWSCTVIDQALFHHLGGYDETLSLYGAAEPEFSVRIWLSGYEIINIPDLLVQHQFQPKPEHDAFRTSLGKTLLSSYLRFACYYLPEQLLFKSYEYFSNLLTCDFDRCMEQIVSKGGWTRRAQLRQVLRYDFSWLLRKFCLGQPVTTAPASTKGRSAWVPVARKNDLLRTLVVIPTYGQHDLTRAVITDCLHEPVRVVVVDNKGDYQPSTNEKVIRPGSNFGWLRANNLAIETELGNQTWDRVVLLNNDVRLSANFFAGIIWAETECRASIVAASYDDWWACQRPEDLSPRQTLEAKYYSPQPRNILTGATDGTAVAIRRDTLERIGLFDAERFGKFGWSGMTDLCYRARASDMRIVATRAAYVHHIGGGHQTAKRLVGERYSKLAGEEGSAGMKAKWGPHWSQLRTIPTQAEVDARFPPRIVVYTAIFGDYDELEPPLFNDVDHICFTDQRLLKVPGWQIRQVQELPAGSSQDDHVRLSRRLKLLPQKCLPEYQIWIWQDANLQIKRHPTDLVAEYLKCTDLATFQHDRRGCIYQEAIACVAGAKDSTDKIYRQVRRYEGERYPSGNGLIWSAMVIRRNTPAVRAFNEVWWAELAKGSRRDQLSFNYVAWRTGLRYATVPHEVVFRKPHKHQSQQTPVFRVKRASREADLTVLLLNWKRPHNLAKVLASIERQTCRPKIFLWNNGDRLNDLRVDWIIDSSQNKACWPRWSLGAMADTEFVCSLDDDLAFGDERVLENLLRYLKNLDQPERLVGFHGVILEPTKPYASCTHVKSTPHAEIAVDIVKGKLLACRRDSLRSIQMASEAQEDDIAVSGLAARGRPLFHRVASLFHDRMICLPEMGIGISHRLEHNQCRETARRKYYQY